MGDGAPTPMEPSGPPWGERGTRVPLLVPPYHSAGAPLPQGGGNGAQV